MAYRLFFIFALTSAFTTLTFAQESWVAYSPPPIAAKGIEGRKFRLTALVRTEMDDEMASARLWVRVDEDHFFENMWDKPIRNQVWNTYVIEGDIAKEALEISFGALCQYSGSFFFDDVRIDVETKNDQWQNIYSEGFEGDDNEWKQGINRPSGSGINQRYTARLSDTNAARGKRCLMISGKDVPNFGENKKAGNYAHVNGIKLYYEIYGDGHPLLVLHGNGGSIENATPHYPELIKKYQVIAVDSRGQGKSTISEAELTYDLMASDINALLDTLGIDSVFIWGQSDGAILGLTLAMEYPDKVKRLLAFGANVLCDSTALFPWFIDYVEKSQEKETDPKEKQLMQLMLKYPQIPFSKLSQIKAPVLIMAGDRDVIRHEHTIKLFQHIPNSHLCIIPGATHGASWEKRDLFLQLLNEFFNSPFEMPTTEDWYR